MKAMLDASEVSRAYGQALRRLAELSGFDVRRVLLGEAGIILKTCAGRTKVGTNKDIDRRSWRHVLGKVGLDLGRASKPDDISVNMGIRGPFGRVWVKTRKGKYRFAGQITQHGQNFRPMNYHWKNGVWSDIQETVEDIAIQSRKAIPKGRRAAGLARQSWLQIADAIGIDIGSVQGGGTLSAAGIAKARAAIATTGKRYNNGTGSVIGDREKTVVTLINNLPYGIPAKLDRTLLGVMAGRAKLFEHAYAKGAFDSMTRAAKVYPWLRVQAPLALN